jgi:hypothetical protein
MKQRKEEAFKDLCLFVKCATARDHIFVFLYIFWYVLILGFVLLSSCSYEQHVNLKIHCIADDEG